VLVGTTRGERPSEVTGFSYREAVGNEVQVDMQFQTGSGLGTSIPTLS
jgi:hypothetical protein